MTAVPCPGDDIGHVDDVPSTSKDDLILAVLDNISEQRVRSIENVLSGCPDPKSCLLALFTILKETVNEKGFRGCAFINAAIERAKPGDPVHARVAEHKKMIRETFLALAKEAGASRPSLLAAQLMMLWDGAVTQAYIHQDPELVSSAVDAARTLIEERLRKGPGPS